MSDEIWCCNGIVLYHNLCLLLILWLSSKTYIAHFGDPRLLVIQVFWWYNIILVIQDFWWYTTYQNALASSIQRRQTKSNYLVIQDIWWSDIFLLQDMGAESMTRRIVEWCHNQNFHSQLLHLSILFDIGYNLQNYFCNLLTFIDRKSVV